MKKIAIHESAHVVFAKSFGYSCSKIKIDHTSRDASSKIDWGKDEIIINTFLHPDQFGEIFNRLPIPKKKETPLISFKFILILCAGSCAEAYYENKSEIDNGTIQYLPIEMGAGDPLLRTDIDKIEKTEELLNTLNIKIPLETRENQLAKAFSSIKKESIFTAINALSDLLIESEKLELNQIEIDTCLSQYDLSL